MKIAVVYNRDSANVINLFGVPNREKIGLRTIKRLTDALKKGGHQVIALEADKDIVDRLERFMPRVVKGERPGMVFNVSYGIQGQARYTHVPSLLEMMGVPYVGSGPLAHSLALDKVVTKMILRQQGLPTPDFFVFQTPEDPIPADLTYPMIVKPKNEAVSFGLKVVENEEELRAAADVIFREFQQPVLVEQYIEGREVNVGILGNNPPEALPPVELLFGSEGPKIYTYDDKRGASGRQIDHACPAPIGEELLERAKDVAVRAFRSLGCVDCARVDMRLDDAGNLSILEINSLPSLGEHGSYLIGAAHIGLDFGAFVNRLVEVASARYFGTPQPPKLEAKTSDPSSVCFSFLTERRDRMEKRLEEWAALSSRSSDPIGLEEARQRFEKTMREVGLKLRVDLTDSPNATTFETDAGLDRGTLLIGHLDVPAESESAPPTFRREPEWLYGEGIASSRAPLVMLEFALRALRSARQLRRSPLGVLYYKDEGRDARYSEETIRRAAARARRVLVLSPGNVDHFVVTQRRGRRLYRLRVLGDSLRPGQRTKKAEPLRFLFGLLEELSKLSDHERRISLSALEVKTERMPFLLPHRVTAKILATYLDDEVADAIEAEMKSRLRHRGLRCELHAISDRPPLRESKKNVALARRLAEAASRWDIALEHQSSVWPSVAGLVPAETACVCGIGPVGRELGTPHEAVQRISLVQRSLMLAEFLLTADRKDRPPAGHEKPETPSQKAQS